MDIREEKNEFMKGDRRSLKITRNVAMELHYEGEDKEVKDFLERSVEIRGFISQICMLKV